MTDTWIWISGWAIHPERFKAAASQALPDYTHHVLAPQPDSLQTLLEIISNSDAHRIGGYSLGSLILLAHLEQLPQTMCMVCLAPFLAFCQEAKRGGKTPLSTLRTLQQRLRQQPTKTIRLFYRMAGLRDEPVDHLPYPIEHLEWGLEQLAGLQASSSLPDHVRGIAGLEDPLIERDALRSNWKHCEFIASCGHDYPMLLKSLQIKN